MELAVVDSACGIHTVWYVVHAIIMPSHQAGSNVSLPCQSTLSCVYIQHFKGFDYAVECFVLQVLKLTV